MEGTTHSSFKGFKILYWTLSLQGFIFMAAGAAVLVAAIVVFYLAVLEYGVKSNYSGALRLHDTNQTTAAVPQLTDALWWDDNHHWARELRAKIAVETNAFEEADRDYKALLAKGHRTPYIHAGIGAMLLRQADQVKDDVQAMKLADSAILSFQQAAGAPEAGVGRGLANLFIAARSKNPAKLIEARTAFEEALKAAEAGQKMTRAGLLDLYAGYGACLAMAGENFELSYSLSKRAANFAPNWETPEANAAIAIAKWLWEKPPPPSEIVNLRAKLDKWLGQSYAKAALRKNYPTLAASWMHMASAMCRVYLLQGDFDRYNSTMNMIVGDERLVKKIKAALLSEVFDPANMSVEPRMIEWHVLGALNGVAGDDGLTSPDDIRFRAMALNNVAVAKEWQIARYQMQGDMTKLLEVRGLLERAVSLDPDCFPAWINLALMQKRIAPLHGSNAKAKAEAEEAARAAADKAEEALRSRGDSPADRERLARIRGLVGGR